MRSLQTNFHFETGCDASRSPSETYLIIMKNISSAGELIDGRFPDTNKYYWFSHTSENLELLVSPLSKQLLGLVDRSALDRVDVKDPYFKTFGMAVISDTECIMTQLPTEDAIRSQNYTIESLQRRAQQDTIFASAICTNRLLRILPSGRAIGEIITLVESRSEITLHCRRIYAQTIFGHKFSPLVIKIGKSIVFDDSRTYN